MPLKDKEKNREYQRRWYAKNKDLQRERNKPRREFMFNWLKEVKLGNSCTTCEEDHPATLDFHHVGEKKFGLDTSNIRSCGWDRLFNELKKCVLICSNCHRKTHYTPRRSG